MSRKMILASIILALILAAGSDNSCASILTTPLLSSPRIIAMGGAYVAVADDANAVFVNPAGLANTNSSADVLINYGLLAGDVEQYCFVGGMRLGSYGGIGFGYNFVGFDNILLKDSDNNLIGSGKYYEGDIEISYGYPVYNWLSLGASTHRIFSSSEILSGYYGEGYGLGVGLLINPLNYLSLGLLINNVLSTEFSYNNGSKERIIPSVTIGLSFMPIKERALFALDVLRKNAQGGGEDDEYSIGGEISILSNLKLRAGGLFSRDSNSKYTGSPSAGMGILFSSFGVDYAWRRPSSTNLDSHFISIGYRL